MNLSDKVENTLTFLQYFCIIRTNPTIITITTITRIATKTERIIVTVDGKDAIGKHAEF